MLLRRNKLKLTKSLNLLKKAFSASYKKTHDKDKKLNDFFKLPKHKLNEETIEPDLKVNYAVNFSGSLNSYGTGEDIDKMDLMFRKIEAENRYKKSKEYEFFKNSTEQETVKISQNILEKLRLKKEFEFSQEYKKKEIMNEYGNYDKYFKNYTKLKDKPIDPTDDGSDTFWMRRIAELEEKYNFKNSNFKETTDLEVVKQLENSNPDEYNLIDYLKAKRETNIEVPNDLKDSLREVAKPKIGGLRSGVKKKALKGPIGDEGQITEYGYEDNDAEPTASTTPIDELDFALTFKDKNIITGRLSPQCREEIYRNYLEGWSVKDLAFKYGILSSRVKMVIWNREIFWKKIYPKLGPSGVKYLIQRENIYGQQFKFVDYGKDLHVMPYVEQGVRIRHLERNPSYDTQVDEKEKKYLTEIFHKVKPKMFDLVSLRFYGQGPKGYILKDMYYRRGQGAMRVSKMFHKFLKLKHTHPDHLPKQVRERAKLGPRLATIGYRH